MKNRFAWKNFLVFFLVFIYSISNAQIGINTTTPDASAALEITSPSSVSKGFLMPHLTRTQRLSISSPADGLMVYDTDAKLYYYYNQTIGWLALNAWQTLGDSNSPNTISTNSVVSNVQVVGNISGTGGISGNTITTNTITTNIITTNNIASNAITSTTLTSNTATTGTISSTVVNATALNVPGFPVNSLVPAGAIIMWSGSTIPSGWGLCDGTIYGSLVSPDLRGRFIVGTGQNSAPASGDINPTYTVGNLGGENNHTLSAAEMPSHNHSSRYTTNNSGGTALNASNVIKSGGNINLYLIGDITSTSGSDQPHENRPPYYALAFIIKLP